MKYKILDNNKIVDEKYLRELLFEYELNDIWDNRRAYFDGIYDLEFQYKMLELAINGEMERVLYFLATNWAVDVDEVKENE